MLLIDCDDTGSDVHSLEITHTGTAPAIKLTNATATTDDIQGTGDSWAVTGQGKATFAELNLADDVEIRMGSSQDILIDFDQSKLLFNAASANTVIQFGDANYNVDLKVVGDATTDTIHIDTDAEDVRLDGFDLTLQDDDILNFGNSDDITMTFDQSKFIINAATADTVVQFGAANYNVDLRIYGDNTAQTIFIDTSEEDMRFDGFDLTLQDDDILNFGDADDVKMYWDQTKFNMVPIKADARWLIGETTYGFDIEYYFESSGTITVDYDGNVAIFDACDIRLNDNDYLLFGDSAVGGSADAYMYWDQTNLKLDCATGRLQIDTDVQIGTASSDEENLTVNGNVTITGTLTHTGSYNPGAISIDDDELLTFGTGDDVTIEWDQSNFNITAAAIDTPMKIGGATYGFDVTYYFESTGTIDIDYDGDNMTFGDKMSLYLGSDDDFTMQWDGTNVKIDGAAASTPLDLGDTTTGFDLTYYFQTAGTIDIDYDGDNMTFSDDMFLHFGTGDDITITYDQSKLNITGAAASDEIRIGDTTNLDLRICCATTTANWLFDTDDSAKLMIFEGVDLKMMDDDVVSFGDSLDVTVAWDQSRLMVTGATANKEIRIGDSTNLDLRICGDTTTDNVFFDTDAEDCQFDGFDLTLKDDDILNFGNSDDITVAWDQSRLMITGESVNNEIRIGDSTNLDLRICAASSAANILFDTDDSAKLCIFEDFDLKMMDDDVISFGDDLDITVAYDQSKLMVTGAAADDEIRIGDSTNLNLRICCASTSANWLFDTDDSAKVMICEGVDIKMMDDDIVSFGDDLDITLAYDQSRLMITGAAANDEIRIGDTTNLDLRICGATTTNNVLFDTDDSTLLCIFNGFDLQMQDEDVIIFGDATNDTRLYWDKTQMIVRSSGNIWIGDATDHTIIAADGMITCPTPADYSGLVVPSGTASPSGTSGQGSAIYYETDASVLWVCASGSTWVSTVALT